MDLWLKHSATNRTRNILKYSGFIPASGATKLKGVPRGRVNGAFKRFITILTDERLTGHFNTSCCVDVLISAGATVQENRVCQRVITPLKP